MRQGDKVTHSAAAGHHLSVESCGPGYVTASRKVQNATVTVTAPPEEFTRLRPVVPGMRVRTPTADGKAWRLGSVVSYHKQRGLYGVLSGTWGADHDFYWRTEEEVRAWMVDDADDVPAQVEEGATSG